VPAGRQRRLPVWASASDWGVGSASYSPGRILDHAHNFPRLPGDVTFAYGRRPRAPYRAGPRNGDLAVIEADTASAGSGLGDRHPSPGSGCRSSRCPTRDGALRVTFWFRSGVDRTFRGPRGRRITVSLEPRSAAARFLGSARS